MNRFKKDSLAPYFEKWDSVKNEIQTHYRDKNKQAVILMNEAIENYTELLKYGKQEMNVRTGKEKYILLPLNGEERFEFVKAKIDSHYAYIQLEASYLETKKKAARLAVSIN